MDVALNPAFVIFAAISPLLIAIIKQSGWSRQTNALIAFVCYIVVGVVGAVVSGIGLTAENLPAIVTAATLIGSAAYALIWNNIGTKTDADLSLDERVTEATSIVK